MPKIVETRLVTSATSAADACVFAELAE
jgi:hypothetical protein